MTATGWGLDNKVSKAGDTMTGTLVLAGTPPLQVTSGSPAAGQMLVSDSSGNLTLGSAGSALAPLTLSSAQSSTSILTVANTTAAPSTAALHVVAAASGDRSFGVEVSGDTSRRLAVDSNGKVMWGPGNATQDTDLYRSAAGVLTTDTALTAGTSISAGTSSTAPVVYGSASASGTLTLSSTSNATKGTINLGTSVYDEVHNWLGVAKTPAVPLDVNGAGSVSGNLAVGGNLSVSGIGQAVWARKASNQVLTSNATLTNDNDIVFTVAANCVYQLIGHFIYNGGANVGNITTLWTAPSGATLDWTLMGQPVGATTGSGTVVTNAKKITDQSSLGTIGTSTNITALLHAILATSSTAGTLQLQWAQLSSSSTSTTMVAGTAVCLRRVA